MEHAASQIDLVEHFSSTANVDGIEVLGTVTFDA